MKYFKNNITSVFLVMLLAALVSCDAVSGDPELPIPLDETLNNTGAFLRVVSVESPGFDVADLSTAEYTFIGELSDVENGQTVETVHFYVSYTATGETNPPTVAETESPIVTVQASELEISEESGLPRGRFSVSLQSAMDALGLTTDDLNLGDVFNVRWEVVTEDGTVFSVDDASPAVGGGFYNSPYNANSGVVQGIPEETFVGSYTITQNNTTGGFSFGPSDPIFTDMTFTADIQLNPANTLNGRMFDVTYIPSAGGFPRTIELTFFRRQDFQSFTAADNWVSVPPPSLDMALGCSAIGLSLGSVPDETVTSFDVDDDSQFTFAIIHNEDGDCGGAAEQVTFTATKN